VNRSKLLKTRRRQRVATLRHIRWVELFVELLLHSEVLSNSLFISTCCSHIIASGRELQTGKTAAPACVVSCNVNSASHFEVCYKIGYRIRGSNWDLPMNLNTQEMSFENAAFFLEGKLLKGFTEHFLRWPHKAFFRYFGIRTRW
jgi:hypothetical protein